MSQIATDGSAAASNDNATSAGLGSGQGTAQSASQVEMVSYPIDKASGLEALGLNPRDPNNIIHYAKVGRQLERDGWAAAAERGGKHGYSGHKLIADLGDEPWDLSRRSPASGDADAEAEAEATRLLEAERQAAAAAQGGGQQGYQNQPRYYTAEETEQRVEARMKKFRAELKAEKEASAKEADQQRRKHLSFQEQDEAMGEALKELGHAASDAEVDWLGGKRKMDVQGTALKGQIREFAEMFQRDSLHSDMPEAEKQAALDLGIPRRFILQACSFLKPHLTAAQRKKVDKEINRMASIPGATVEAGAGGTPQPDPEKMSRAERVAEFNRRAEARGLPLGR